MTTVPFGSVGELLGSLAALVAGGAVSILVAWALATPLSALLIRVRARRLPRPLAERFSEEWLAEAHAIESRLRKAAFACGLLLTSTRRFVEAIGGPGAVPGNLIVSFDVRIYSTIWARVIALVVDGVVVSTGALLLGLLLRGFVPVPVDPRYSASSLIVGFFISTLLTFLVEVYLVMRFGGSPGKLLMKLRIVPMDGGTLTWQQALLRETPDYVMAAISAAATIVALTQVDLQDLRSLPPARQSGVLAAQVATIWWMTGYRLLSSLWVSSQLLLFLFTEERRPLHDFLAGTVVVNTKAPTVITEADIVPRERTRIFQ